MNERFERAYVIFDGDCGICTSFSEMVKRKDRGRQFLVTPYQKLGESGLKELGLTAADCSRRMYAVSRSGRIYPGAFGVNYILWKWFPWSLLVGLIYLIPVFLLFELIGYRLVANNRARLSSMFGLKACMLDTHQEGSRSDQAGTPA